MAIGIWFKLGGTQLADPPHRLFRFQAGQLTIPLSIPVTSDPGHLRGFTRDGREVRVSVDTHQACLEEVPDSDVWAALLVDSCLPYVALRRRLSVECPGLGGAELGSPTPWELLVRTGRHHEEVYGPSLARLEFAGLANETPVQYVGLGLTKASHEFLMLHYFATDSAQIWDDLDATQDLVFPHAPARRAHAYEALLIGLPCCSLVSPDAASFVVVVYDVYPALVLGGGKESTGLSSGCSSFEAHAS